MLYRTHAKFHSYGLSSSAFVTGLRLLPTPSPPYRVVSCQKGLGWLGLRRSAKAFEINFTSTLSKEIGHQF